MAHVSVRTRGCFGGLLLLLSLATPTSSHAQNPKAGSTPPARATTGAVPVASPAPRPALFAEVKLEEARRHFEQGVALFEEGNFTAALAEFQAAHSTAPASTILFNIGLTYKALYRYPEAVETLERYLVEGSADGQMKPDRRAQVIQLVAEMKSLLAPVTFALSPTNAKVSVDGRNTPLPANHTVALAAGSHQVEVSAPGHTPERREFSIAAGTPTTLEFRLVAIPRTGKVRITSSQPNTRLSIDGQSRGFAPQEIELDAGGHQLEARADGFEPFRSELMLAAGQARNIDVELQLPAVAEGRAIYQRWWFWTGLGTAVLGGTAAAFLLRPGLQAPLGATLSTYDASSGQ